LIKVLEAGIKSKNALEWAEKALEAEMKSKNALEWAEKALEAGMKSKNALELAEMVLVRQAVAIKKAALNPLPYRRRLRAAALCKASLGAYLISAAIDLLPLPQALGWHHIS